MKKSIIWLASYPKSGNTWLRIFLANYMVNADKPVPINQVHRFAMGDTIAKTYRMVAGGQNFDPNNPTEVLPLRDKVLRGIVGNNADINLVKTHNICGNAFGFDLIPAQYTRSSIYIVRNPLDMVMSYARHHSGSLEESVEAIARSDNVTLSQGESVITFMGSWTEHVNSWTQKAPYPQLLLRYEDMLNDPEANFAKVLEHIGMPIDDIRLKRAIKFASFKELKKQEKTQGFIEKSKFADSFFTKGQSGHWEKELPKPLADQIIRDHRPTMKRLGYLT